MGISEEAGGFSTLYEKWTEAQQAVVDFERAIFRDGHPLTEGELARLQALRATAADCLQQVVSAMDAEYGRLVPHPSRGAPGRPSA